MTASVSADGADRFRLLTDPYRHELHVHCYRMLGSVDDADDVLQETRVAAWQGLAEFEGNAAPAFAVQMSGRGGYEPAGIVVLDVTSAGISGMTRFLGSDEMSISVDARADSPERHGLM